MPPEVDLRLDRDPPDYAPGDRLVLWFRLDPRRQELDHAWIEIGWETTGLGDQDSLAILQEDLIEGRAFPAEIESVRETVLPFAPYSYAGEILKIHWVARIVAVPKKGEPVSMEQAFRVGSPEWLGSDDDSHAQRPVG